jgi:putative transposase
MGRPYRTALGGYVYHMLNRGNGRLRIFHKDGDYEAFERILGEALEDVPGMRLLAYCLLPNHWTGYFICVGSPRRVATWRAD